jgi:hypothetical protein
MCAYHLSNRWEDCHQADLGKKQDPISKTTRAKTVEGTAQVVRVPAYQVQSLEFKP